MLDRQATAIIPIRKNVRPWKEDCPAAVARNETLRATRHYGRVRRAYAAPPGPRFRFILEALDRVPRPKPDRGEDALAGSLEPVALNLRDLKAFGERIAARDPDRQTAEIHICVALMNRLAIFRDVTANWSGKMGEAVVDDDGKRRSPDGFSPHGLRKESCRSFAEAGCSAQETMAISGDQTLAEVTRQTLAANRVHLAQRAVAALERKEAGT